jgi:hypothetical protein
MKHSHVTNGPIWIACFLRPCIHSLGLWMIVKIKHLNNSLPNSFSPKLLFHWNAFDMGSLCAVQSPNHIAQLVKVVA